MRGTEKQVKWAEDIINNTIGTIRLNMDRTKNSPVAPIRAEACVWEYMGIRFSAMLKAEKMQDAYFIISNRNADVFDPLKLMSMIRTMSVNTGCDLMAAAKRVLG